MDTRVSLERLDVDNYSTWAVRMRFTLISKDLVEARQKRRGGHRYGRRPEGAGAHRTERHGPSPAIAGAARDGEGGVGRAGGGVQGEEHGAPRGAEARDELAEEGGGGADDHVRGARKELRDQLAAAGLVTDDEEVAAALLAGLPADYDVIVAVLETTAHKVDLDVLLGSRQAAEREVLHNLV